MDLFHFLWLIIKNECGPLTIDRHFSRAHTEQSSLVPAVIKRVNDEIEIITALEFSSSSHMQTGVESTVI